MLQCQQIARPMDISIVACSSSSSSNSSITFLALCRHAGPTRSSSRAFLQPCIRRSPSCSRFASWVPLLPSLPRTYYIQLPTLVTLWLSLIADVHVWRESSTWFQMDIFKLLWKGHKQWCIYQFHTRNTTRCRRCRRIGNSHRTDAKWKLPIHKQVNPYVFELVLVLELNLNCIFLVDVWNKRSIMGDSLQNHLSSQLPPFVVNQPGYSQPYI